MRRRIGFACLAGMLALMAWLNWSGNKATSAQEVTPAAKRHFLQIGKSYEFSTGGLGLISGKILEEPKDNWVMLECVRDRKKDTVWVNLNLIASIEQAKGAD
jgi:hypothetical protein